MTSSQRQRALSPITICHTNIARGKDENLYEISIENAKKIEVEIEGRDISWVHRLPSKNNAPNIIARPTNRAIANRLISQSKKLRIQGNAINMHPSYPIYFNEQLTEDIRDLLARAKELRDNGTIKFIWVKDNMVFIREDEGIF